MSSCDDISLCRGCSSSHLSKFYPLFKAQAWCCLLLEAFPEPPARIPIPLTCFLWRTHFTVVNTYAYSFHCFPLPKTAFSLCRFSCFKAVRDPLNPLWGYQGQICERKTGKLKRNYSAEAGVGWQGRTWWDLSPLCKRGGSRETVWDKMGRWVLSKVRGLLQGLVGEGLREVAGHSRIWQQNLFLVVCFSVFMTSIMWKIIYVIYYKLWNILMN